MNQNLNHTELIQKLETAEERIAELERDLVQKNRIIAEYQHTEQEFQDREHKLNELLEILPVGISILDAEHNVVYSNPALQKILQINSEGLLNGNYRNRRYVAANGTPMPPDGFASRQAQQRGEPVYDVETGIVKEDGNIIWTNVSAIPVDFSDWKIVVTTNDITTRKSAEDEQRRSQDRLAKIFQTSPVPMLIGDAETGQIIEVNQAYEGLVGYERNEVVGHTPFELNIYANKEQVARAMHEIHTQGGMHGAELTLRTKSGELRNILGWSQVLRLGNQQMINLGTAIDVTEHKLIEQSLRESEARYRSLFENSPVVIWEEDFSAVKLYLEDLRNQGVTDLDAYLTAHEEVLRECIQLIQVTGVNQAGLQLYGTSSKADLVGSLGNTFPREALAGFKNELLRVAKGDLSFHGESFVRTFDGHLHRVIVDWIVLPGYEQTYEKVLVTLSDVTDLRQAQEKYQDIFENSAEGIFQTTPDGRFLSANPALARIYGYDSPRELVESVTDISSDLYLRPEERNEFTQMLESKGAIESFESQDRRTDGSVIWTSTSARVVRDADGRTLYYEGFLQDITERKRAEAAALESEARYHRVLDAMMEGCQIIDFEWRYVYVNDVVAKQGKKRSEELLHHTMMEVYPGIENTEMFVTLRRCMEQRLPERMENRFVFPDGSSGWFELSIQPTQEGIFILSTDVTERKQAEEARHEAELRYRALFEQSHDAIFIINLAGQISVVNQGAASMLGYSQDELLRLSVKDISAEPAQSQQTLQGLIGGGYMPIYERIFRKKDGSILHVEINAELVRDAQGNPLHVQSVVRDITDRRRAEIELQHRNEDLGLINAINEIIVQGGNLEAVVNVLAKDLRRIFSSQGTSLYMLSPDERSLAMQQYAMPSELTRKIEQVLGSTIPIIKIPIQEGGVFARVLHSGQGIIVSDPKEIQNWLSGFVETEFLPSIARSAIRKLLPQLSKLLNIKSTILVPLRSNEKTIGLLNVSSAGSFTDEDLKRIESIGVQLTAAIQRQQANEKLQRSEEFLNSIQNALSASIVILDEVGTIVRVNSAWRKFGEQNGLTDPRSCIGRNYLEICDSASGANAEEAPVVARAIRDVIARQRKEAWIEYPCHGPEEQRWFLLRITKFEDGNKIWVVLAHENITKRKQAQDSLQWSESLLAQAGKMAHLGAWEIAISKLENLNENPLRWSDEVYRIFGYEPSEVEATNDLFLQRVHPDDRQKVQKAISQAIVQKKPYEVEHRIIRSDGVERIVEERADLIYDQQGQLIQILGAVQDITERKRTEQALRETSEQFRALFEASPEAIMLIDPHGDWPILDCNATACSMNGYAREELIGQTIDILHLSPGDAAGRRQCLESIRRVGILRYEDFHRHKDGHSFPIEISTSLITVGGREIVLGIDRDVTERKRAEENLRHSETRYRLATKAANDVIWEWDATTHQLLWSENAQVVFGYSAEEIGPEEKWWDEHIHPDDLERILSKLNELMSGEGSIWSEEYRFQRKDGSYAHISDRAYIERDADGNPLRMIGAMSDITERKQNEAETRRRADEFAVLYETARDLAAQYHLPTLLNTIVERACKLLHTLGGGIYLYDEARDDLEMVLAVGSPVPTGTRLRMGEGMAGRVAQTQQRLIVDDYRMWADRSSQFESLPFRAILEVPLLYGGKVIGVLVVHELNESERKFTEVDAHLLSLFAEYAASAVHAARLLQETRRRAEETAALLETSLALTNLDLDSTLQTVGEHAQSLFDADGCRIFLMEPDRETLRCVLALHETPEAFSHLRIQLGVGVTGAVAASGQAEIVNEMQNDPRAMQIAGTPDEDEAIMFAPLKERERTIGVLSVRRVGTPRPFQSSDLALLEALASMSASAVSNARLFEETQRRLAQMEALYVNGLAVGRLLEPRAIGERIIETFSQYLSWHHVTIRLCKDASDELELIAFHLPHMEGGTAGDEEQRFKTHVGRVGQGLSGWVVQTGQPIRTSNLSEQPHYVNTYEDMQSGLYMPLKVGDRVIGVISVESEERDAFSEQDERLLATLANQAATAFENARLYQSAQQEIRERRIAEEALRQSEENYRRLARELEERVHERTAEVQDLYDNAPCGYLSLDADGSIVRINQTELDWLGYTREEILGRSFPDFITYESHNIFKETFPTFKQQGSIRDLELEMLRKDGSVLPILVSATAIYDQEGSYLTSRSTLSDDTSRKHAMETLRLANSEMKRAMRMKDEFLANMSHELRTPLNAILGLSESLLEQTAGPINERQQKYLGTVNESGRHLLELINDILDLAKIESGQIKIDPGRVNINTACETSLRMIKQLAQKKNQVVEVEIEKEIGYVWADERRLKQMMVNLLSNAVKFTPVDGQLGLKARIDRHEMKLLITVWDHGIGIREQDLNRLFRPFVQLDSSLSRESAGTGLGLALVAEMARLHGGSVSVTSQPGQGTEFTIILPWDPAITTDTLDRLKISGKIPIMKRTSTEKQTILLVEDTDSVVLMLRDYLELSGYKVEIARDGMEGVSKAIAVQPDLVLMDVQMPGLDGLEATRRIRRDSSLKNTPIIALTALAMPSDRERCLEAGMNDYLSKPINLRELAKAVLRNLPDSGTGKKS